MGRIKYCIIFFLLCAAVNTAAQEPASIHFDISNGLPTNIIFSLKQDRKGFLWIGTTAGLVRYDGSNFITIPNLKSRSESVSGLKEDKTGKIWFNNFSGQIFNIVGDSISRFTAWDKYYKNGLNEFAFDQQNGLYVNNGYNYVYGINLLNNQTNKFDDSIYTKFSIASMYDGTIVFTKIMETSLVYAIENKTITKIPFYGLEKYALSPAMFSNYFKFSNSFLNKQTIGFLKRNPSHKHPLLVYYKNKAFYAHPATKVLQKLGVFPVAAYDDDDGNLFIGTENGLLWLKQKGEEYYLQKQFFENETISEIIKVKEGGIWVATLNNGLHYIPDLNMWLSRGTAMGLQTEGLSHLAVSQNGAIYGASLAGEIFNFHQFSENVIIKFPFVGQREVQALDYDSFTNRLFVSKLLTQIISPTRNQTSDEVLLLSSPKEYVFRKDGVIFSSGNRVMVSYKKGNNTLASKLVKEFQQKPEMIIANKDMPYASIILSNQRNKGIYYQEKEQILWAGFVDGMKYYQNNSWHIILDANTQEPIYAVAFVELLNGTICAATRKQGLYFIKNKKIVSHLTTDNGLVNNNIKKITVNKDIIWMIERNIVQGYDYYNKKFKNIGAAFSAFNLELNDIKIVRDTVFLATSKGIQFFPTNINSINKAAPFASINSFIVDGKAMAINQPIILPFSTKGISIALQGSAIKSAGNYYYQYRLLGSDTNWVKVKSSENIVRYVSLLPGKYSFQLRVINEDGIYSKENPVIKFSIEQQWWKQWWFILIIAFMVLLVFYTLFSIRLAVIKKNNQTNIDKLVVQEEMRNSQLSALKAQMNPHFIFNVLNSIQEIILLSTKKQAILYLGKFADLMRSTLEQSNKKAITLDDELKSLQLYLELEALRFNDNFKYSIDASSIVNLYNIQFPALLIQPYVENAIKHGLLHKVGAKNLNIEFSLLREDTLSCCITDYGVGRVRSSEINQMRENRHISFATGATQKRLELLNLGREKIITVNFVDLFDEFGNNNGTKVCLYIPVFV